MFYFYLFSEMAYEYVAISGHPEDVISISIGNEAESYALAHYKGSLRRGLNPSTSGVLQNVTTMTSNTDTPTNDVPDECTSDTEKGCSSSSGTVPDECNQDPRKGCSSSSGTAHGDNSAAKETVQTPVSSSSDTEIKSNVDPDDSDDEPLVKKCMLLPKRCRSREAIQRRRRLYKIRKRNRQQKHLKSPQKHLKSPQKHLKTPQKFEYRELTITRYFQ